MASLTASARRSASALALVGLLLGGIGLSACSGGRQAAASSTTVASTTVTTTTLAPLKLSGTRETGLLSFLGSVSRIRVAAVPDGASAALLPAPGTAGYAKTVSIAYRQFGSGKPLVLLEGEDATMNWWSPALLRQLSGHYRVTIFDLPGVGYSGPAPVPVTVDWLADLTAGLISELHITTPVVLGWGLGGQVALALAERHPSVVSDLVLVDTGVPVGGSRPVETRAAATLSGRPLSPVSLLPLLFGSSQSSQAASWLSWLERQVPDNVTAAAVRAEASLESHFWHHTDVAERLGSVHQPSLVVTGAEDGVFPPRDGALLARGLKGSQFYRWNGTGYGSLLAEPAHFAQLIEGFTG